MTVTRTVWGFIERRDHRLMRRMNRWRAPRWIRYWMIAATRMGDGWLWYGLGAMLLDDGVFDRAGGRLFLSVAGGGAVFCGAQYRGVAHRAGHAFPQRRACRRRAGNSAGVRLDYGIRFAWFGLMRGP